MVTNNTYEYGIKYEVKRIDDNRYLLNPMSIEGGLSDTKIFSTGDRMLPILNDKRDFKYKYVVDNIFATEDLEKMYDYEEDTDFLSNFFYQDFQNKYYLVKVDEDGKLVKYEIDLKDYDKVLETAIYQLNKENPSLTINNDMLNKLNQCQSIEEMKVLLLKYKTLLNKFKDYSKEKGITRVQVKDGEIEPFDINKTIVDQDKYKDSKLFNLQKGNDSNKEIDYNELVSAIKEKIVGHDESIETLANVLYMNYTATDDEEVESILIVGPTGTGKTATVKAACEYLRLPFVHVNTANLVPAGIKGYTVERAIKDLRDKANGDLKLAQRGAIFFDEFDKLGRANIDIKEPIKDILLSISDGAEIPVNLGDDNFIFDSRLTNRIYAGVFEEIYGKQKTMGFGGTIDSNSLFPKDDELKRKIVEKKYYTSEDLDRITRALAFTELTKEDKKKILLTSKLSAYAKKRARYLRQFGIELVASDDYINAIIDQTTSFEVGMRSVNNIVKKSMSPAEIEILKNKDNHYKKLVLTKDTVNDPNKFDLY